MSVFCVYQRVASNTRADTCVMSSMLMAVDASSTLVMACLEMHEIAALTGAASYKNHKYPVVKLEMG